MKIAVSATCLWFFTISFSGAALACSVCKITENGITVVGNNEDMWSHKTRICFEAGNDSTHGAAYVGHRKGLPQGGMNEAGLVYDGFTVPLKTDTRGSLGNRAVSDPDQLLRIFSKNEEYERYLDFKTPLNSDVLFGLMVTGLGVMLGGSVFFFISLLRDLIRQKAAFFQNKKTWMLLGLLLLNTLNLILMPILILLQPVYYFGIADSLGGFPITQVVYFPLAITLGTILLVIFSWRVIITDQWPRWSSFILTANTLALIINTLLYVYLGFVS